MLEHENVQGGCQFDDDRLLVLVLAHAEDIHAELVLLAACDSPSSANVLN